jgi:hypothetical protein
MSILNELIEDIEKDKRILKSFKIKNSLSSDIFEKKNGSYILREDVREKLLKITDNFLEYLKIDFFVFDVHLTGSLSNYNWSKYSDVDLHIMYDINEIIPNNMNNDVYKKIIEEFFETKKKNWGLTTNIKIKNYEVELYVQDINDKSISSGIYSVLNNEWVIEPNKLKTPHDIDEKKILEKSNDFEKQIDDLVKDTKSGDEKIKQVELIKNKLKKFRQSGLESGGEFSYENLTFKLLRRNGYIKKLMGIKTKVIDKELSIKQ